MKASCQYFLVPIVGRLTMFLIALLLVGSVPRGRCRPRKSIASRIHLHRCRTTSCISTDSIRPLGIFRTGAPFRTCKYEEAGTLASRPSIFILLNFPCALRFCPRGLSRVPEYYPPVPNLPDTHFPDALPHTAPPALCAVSPRLCARRNYRVSP